MITATVGTALLVVVGLTSFVVARRRLPYEWWYAIHLVAYAGIALAWFHQIPTGNELALDETAANYWRALYLLTLGVLVVFRLGVPIVNALRFRLRVAEVVPEGEGRGLGARRRRQARPARRPAGAVLPLAIPHARPLVGSAPVLAFRGARRRLVAADGEGGRGLLA